jgi:predicted TIM-barrel fold metal-dependent hydrolase
VTAPEPTASTLTAGGVVDAAVHVVPSSRAELEQYLSEPWRSRSFPSSERHVYARLNEYWPDAGGDGLPGSDPAVVARDVFDRLGASHAVLLPLSRGLLPSLNLSVSICAAMNDWLVDRFLSSDAAAGRFSGTIRVDPRDPEAAVQEIERWADHPSMVRVGVPAQALQPYGHASYMPIWRTAAQHGLSIVVHTEAAAGVDFAPTNVGYPRLAAEYQCLTPWNFAFHIASLFAEATFRWIDDLVFVFADGGFDGLWPIVWRIDKDWRGNRSELPATTDPPGVHLRNHIRFITHRLEGPSGDQAHRDWIAASRGADELLLFGSNYPQWDTWSAREAAAGIPEHLHERILSTNARDLYRLHTAVGAR